MIQPGKEISRRDLLRSSTVVAAPFLVGATRLQADVTVTDPTSGEWTPAFASSIADYWPYLSQNCLSLNYMKGALQLGSAILDELINKGITPYLAQATSQAAQNASSI